MNSHLLRFIYKDHHAPQKLGGSMNLVDVVQNSSAVILSGKTELQIVVKFTPYFDIKTACFEERSNII